MKVVYLYVSMEHNNERDLKQKSLTLSFLEFEKMQYKTPLSVDYALKPELYTASDTWY